MSGDFPPLPPIYPSSQKASDDIARWYADEYRRLWHVLNGIRRSGGACGHQEVAHRALEKQPKEQE